MCLLYCHHFLPVPTLCLFAVFSPPLKVWLLERCPSPRQGPTHRGVPAAGDHTGQLAPDLLEENLGSCLDQCGLRQSLPEQWASLQLGTAWLHPWVAGGEDTLLLTELFPSRFSRPAVGTLLGVGCRARFPLAARCGPLQAVSLGASKPLLPLLSSQAKTNDSCL